MKTYCNLFPLLFMIILLYLPWRIICQASGWKMQDRFIGFRYAIYYSSNNEKGQTPRYAMELIQKVADRYFCFGWSQYATISKEVVGEVRCEKQMGLLMKSWMQKTYADRLEVHEYNDTKIKLHFSYFKLLDSRRITCFRDLPHQCHKWKIDPDQPHNEVHNDIQKSPKRSSN